MSTYKEVEINIDGIDLYVVVEPYIEPLDNGNNWTFVDIHKIYFEDTDISEVIETLCYDSLNRITILVEEKLN